MQKTTIVGMRDSHIICNAINRMQRNDKIRIRTYMACGKVRNAFMVYQHQYSILNVIKQEFIMVSANETHFTARITEFVHGNKYDYYRFVNTDNDENHEVPEWCILDFVVLPAELMDSTGEHIKVGSIIQLRETMDGRFLPSNIYERKGNSSKRTRQNRMSEESLYDGTILYKRYGIDELWLMFAKKCSEIALCTEQILTALDKQKNASESEQASFLCGILGLNPINLGVQEGTATEFKSSFTHCANPRQNERAYQYREIFKDLVSMANSHQEGCVFVGVNNDAEVVGIEDELLNDVPFANRADFIADFKNQLNISVKNFEFSSSITLSWFRTEDNKLFCRINVPEWHGNMLLMNGTELYVRDEARKQQLKDNDLINYILKNCTIAA